MRFDFLTTPGSWLFSESNLAWLRKPELVTQLPRSYQRFASYCGSDSYRIPVAEGMLRSLIAVRRYLGREGVVPLRLGSSTLYLDLHDPRFLRVPVEASEAEAQLRSLLRIGDTFIDSGANHGAFSIAAAKLVGSEGYIVAIEPQPRLARVVERSLRETGVPFDVHQTALGHRSGSAMLFRQWASSGSAGLVREFSAASRHRSFRVPVERVDDLFRDRRLPGGILWKLDIEGGELQCLQGASQLLRERRPKILMEINPEAMRRAGTTPQALAEALKPGCYRFLNLSLSQDAGHPQDLRSLTDQMPGEILLVPS